MIGYLEIKRFIKKLIHKLLKLVSAMRDYTRKSWGVFKDSSLPGEIRIAAMDVIVNGFIVWIAFVGISYLTGYWKFANPLLIPMYGIIPWWIILFIRELRKKE